MSECTQCPYTVGDSYRRDCCFPDCMGGWEAAYKQLSDKNQQLQSKIEIKDKMLEEIIYVLGDDPNNREWEVNLLVRHVRKALNI